MPPSKKIFLGATAMVTGIAGQLLIGVLVATADYSAMSGESAEKLLQQTQLGLNALTVSWIFLLLGLVMFLVGTWQSARFTEHLAQRLAELEGKQ